MFVRGLAYGVLGWSVDRLFTTLTGSLRHGRMRAPSVDLGLVAVYALTLPLYEPVRDRVRHAPLGLRAAVYGVGILAVEYTSGRVIRRLRGAAPWDYTGARWTIEGLTRLDYFPLWAIAGLAMEGAHDALVRGRPAAGTPAMVSLFQYPELFVKRVSTFLRGWGRRSASQSSRRLDYPRRPLDP
ncbi:MAG: hypothetical protein M3T56_06585 [Chloroflexota bacterium]|nr:hypothetical protein [Chloroflexota bacterium]